MKSLTPRTAVVFVAIISIPAVYFYFRISNRKEETIEQTAQSLKLSRLCPKESILCGVEHNVQLNGTYDRWQLDSLKSVFHRLVTSVAAGAKHCPKVVRFGRASDGGYDVCLTPPFIPTAGACLIYSFGINKDWSFDEAMANYQCEVHSFDPSIGLEDHLHAPRVHFHNIGLWGEDFVNNKNWTLESLSTIRRRLGHEKRPIDILKIDVESAEWPFLRDITVRDPDQLSDVRQLLLEIHTPRFNPTRLSTTDLLEMIHYVQRLLTGFVIHRNRQANGCCDRFSPLMPRGVHERCCHELFLLNKRFISERSA